MIHCFFYNGKGLTKWIGTFHTFVEADAFGKAYMERYVQEG